MGYRVTVKHEAEFVPVMTANTWASKYEETDVSRNIPTQGYSGRATLLGRNSQALSLG